MTFYESDHCALLLGNSLELLKTLPDESIDSVVTDPPYELGFMGKKWDASGIANSVDLWREVLRVLKPGGHLLAFGATRTYHRMACAIEDAGFEVRDSLHWMYGTGFPKSLNVGEGRGTALKPAHEPIILARKPLIGTVAVNALTHGTGALNIDGCRIGTEARPVMVRPSTVVAATSMSGSSTGATSSGELTTEGRWPANVLLDEWAAGDLDVQSGFSTSPGKTGRGAGGKNGRYLPIAAQGEVSCPSDSGGASRFFYVSKASRRERDLGCEHLPAKTGGEATDREDGSAGVENPRAGAGRTGGARNTHCTVKPIRLMRYLVRLVTPPGGIVLDPFNGSGTTGCAAALERFDYLGMDLSEEYLEISKCRILAAKGGEDERVD